ncbi:Peripheral-type benzodiazepine receptor-associated protein 1, partial [Dissostichus eleginoides]
GGVDVFLHWVLTQTWKPYSLWGQMSGSYPVLEAPSLGRECQQAASFGLVSSPSPTTSNPPSNVAAISNNYRQL